MRAYYFEMIASQLLMLVPAEAADGSRCLLLQPTTKQIGRRDGVPEAVYEEGLLEHPAIHGLMLTKAERLYASNLEIVEVDGRERFETARERRFRIKWQKPVIQTPTSTSKDFVRMNHALFKRQ